jgi:hypothetical protein
MVHHDCHTDGVVSTTLAAQHATSFSEIMMNTSDGEGHHAAVVGSAASTSSTVSTTIHGDVRSPMGVASMTVSRTLLLFFRMLLISALFSSACLLPSASRCVARTLRAAPCLECAIAHALARPAPCFVRGLSLSPTVCLLLFLLACMRIPVTLRLPVVRGPLFPHIERREHNHGKSI